jgi:hypothetical protein
MNKAGEITFSQGVAEAGAKDNEPLQFHEGASDDCNCCNAGPLDRHYDPERIRTPFASSTTIVCTQCALPIFDGTYGEVHVVLCVLRYRVGAYGDGNRLNPNRLDSQVHAHMSRNLQAIEQNRF